MARKPAPKGLPTKDAILDFVRTADGPVGKREIARAFDIRGAEKIPLKRLLAEMADEGLLKGRTAKRDFQEPGKLPPVTVLDMTVVDGDGTLRAAPANWEGETPPPAIRVAEKRRRPGPALGPGARALCRLERLEDGSYEARPIKVLDARPFTMTGVFRASRTGGRVTPIDKRGRAEDVFVPAEATGRAKTGDVVVMEVAKGAGRGPKRAKVKEILGDAGDPRTFSLLAAEAHGIRLSYPPTALEEAEKAAPPRLTAYREDLREIPFVTIDPDDAKDHDDAVFAAPDDDPKNKGGWRVMVAIADVAFYVRPGSAIDREAKKRGNSTYLPDRVIPMIPERLSNGLCSLKEGANRACLFVDMRFDKSGGKVGHRFGRGLMRVAANISYEEAQAAEDGTPNAKTAPYAEAVVKPLFAAHRALMTARERRGPLDLDLPEHRVRLNEDGFPMAVETRARLEAHKLIEEMMIQANVAAAETLEAKKTPLVYRVHDAPSKDKIDGLIDYLETIAIEAPRAQTWTPKKLNGLLAKATSNDLDRSVSQAMLRAQAQAVYATENLGHFGLNLRRYAHFTSPIRRYADLIVHRGLIRALGLGPGGLEDGEAAALDGVAADISGAERASMAAERDANDRFLAAFMADHVGATFTGVVQGVARFGLFVALDDTGADGFVPVASLGPEFWIYDEAGHALVSEETGARHRLGQKVEVRLEEANPLAGALRFALLSEPEPAREGASKRRPGPRGRQGRARPGTAPRRGPPAKRAKAKGGRKGR